MPVIAEIFSRVHRGLKAEVDMLWPRVMADIMSLKGKRELWFCGHSLGAAMATTKKHYFETTCIVLKK